MSAWRRRFVILGLVLAVAGALNFALRTGDAELSRSLRLTLAAADRVSEPENARFQFQLCLSSTGGELDPGGRAIVIRADGRALDDPSGLLGRTWDGITPPNAGNFSRAVYWYLPASGLAAWLGGAGRHEVTVSLGPVTSNGVVVEARPDGSAAVLQSPPLQR